MNHQSIDMSSPLVSAPLALCAIGSFVSVRSRDHTTCASVPTWRHIVSNNRSRVPRDVVRSSPLIPDSLGFGNILVVVLVVLGMLGMAGQWSVLSEDNDQGGRWQTRLPLYFALFLLLIILAHRHDFVNRCRAYWNVAVVDTVGAC
jgi:hypothetical protein